MAISTTIQRPCTRCGQPVEAVLHKSYVIEDDASLRALLENRFHLLDCAACGERRSFEADFLVTNKPRDMFIQVILRDEDVKGMIESFRSMLGTGDVFARIVAGRDDAVEKVKLRTQGLDDVAIEAMKHFLRSQIGDTEGKTQRRFDRIEGDDVLFTVRVPGQPARTMKLPKAVYHHMQEDLGTAAHARDFEVDERLAGKLMKAWHERSKAEAAVPEASAKEGAPKADPAPGGGVAAAPGGGVAAASGVVAAASGGVAAAPAGSFSKRPLKVTHAGNDRRGRRFCSDGSLLLLADFVAPTTADTPTLLMTETVENLVGKEAKRWAPIVDLTKSKLHAATYRTPDDIALGEKYVTLLLGLGRPLDLGTTERLGPVLLRDGAEIVGALMPLNLPPENAAADAKPAAPDEDRVPCPQCKWLIPQGDRFCEACGVALEWKGDAGVEPSHPDLSPGRVLVSESFETRPFPGRTALEESRPGVMEARPVHGGKGLTYYVPVTSSYVDYARPLRDACVRATFTPLDPGVRVGLCARHSVLGGIQIYYLFDVMPLAGRAWCARGVQTPDQATSTRLGTEVKLEPFAPGASVELELRVAGATLRAFVNGRPVLAAHDAAFGSGAFGIRVGREHDIQHPVRVICHGYEVREVAP